MSRPCSTDYAEIWRAAEKVVYSRTLQTVSSARTRIEREFDPDAVRRLKEASEPDISVGGAELAGQAIAAGLVDECQLFLARSSSAAASARCLTTSVRGLELLDERRFTSGVVLPPLPRHGLTVWGGPAPNLT